jgi:exodeoxyribonuclease VII small subunit
MNYIFWRGIAVSIDTEKLKSLSFEAALKELERIVDHLSTGEANLDELLQMYEEGIAYLNHCQSRLGEAEAKIKVLSAQIPGSKTTEENNG